MFFVIKNKRAARSWRETGRPGNEHGSTVTPFVSQTILVRPPRAKFLVDNFINDSKFDCFTRAKSDELMFFIEFATEADEKCPCGLRLFGSQAHVNQRHK